MTSIAITFVAALGLATAIPASATDAGYVPAVDNEEIEHGGGCRKDSLRGKWCHAGSKPYHCH